ncbi:MAG TPA: hypothetical protein ENJ45_00645 [Phaeodactylibacter sp.]|nr:hypothetical protein [Phaeodactylibacter sp.]
MENLIPILINTVAGGGGGFLTNMLKKNGLSTLMNIVAGAVGGNALPALASVAGLIGTTGGDSSSMITSAITALVGGGAGSLIGGLFGGKKS